LRDSLPIDMLLSALSFLVVAQSSSEVPEGLVNNPVFETKFLEKFKTHILCTVNFSPENHAVYEVTWKNLVQPDRSQLTLWRMRISCCMLQTHIHNMQYLLLFHGKNGDKDAPHCYVYNYIPCLVKDCSSGATQISNRTNIFTPT